MEASLAAKVREANHAYHNTDEPIMSDADYDLLVEQLAAINPNHKVLKEVGAEVHTSDKVKTPVPMPSLKKIKKQKDIANWTKDKKGPFVVTDKLDGVSGLLAVNEDGKVKLYTRGDGTHGRDITELRPLMKKCFPTKVPPKGTIVRGEFILPKKTFIERFADKFANPRNTVSGVINAKRPDNKVAAELRFVAYNVYDGTNMSEQIKTMDAMGFETPHHTTLQELQESDLATFLTQRMKDSTYEIDGIVLADNSQKPNKPKNNDLPSHTVAFKTFATHDHQDTKVNKVEWNISKDGKLIPTVHVDPVSIDGVTILKATGFNAKWIQENGVGPGAEVQVVRSGAVIPKIQNVLSPSPAGPQMPNQTYVWDATKTHVESVDVNDKAMKEIQHFFVSLKPDGVSGKTIDKLIAAGHNSIDKILKLTAADVLKLDGMQTKSANNLVNSIEKAIETATCFDIVVASNTLGRGMGHRKLQAVETVYPNFILRGLSVEEIVKVPGFQTTTAKALAEGLPKAKKFLEHHGWTAKCEVTKRAVEVPVDKDGDLIGTFVVFTGFRDKDMETELKKRGAVIQDKVNAKTTNIIAKDPNAETAKLNAARAKGIKITDSL